MNILITGCAGFIGSHATDLFLSLGYTVVGVDCLTYASNLENLKDCMGNNNFSLEKVDICDTEKIKNIVIENKCEWIINFAAESHVDNSIESIDAFIHSNIVGVKSLLEVCRETNTKILHISTDEVYGSTRDGSFSEDTRFNPKNPYSATKASAEHIITSYSNTHNIDYIIVRPSNNFGPRQHGEKLLPTIIKSIKKGKKIPIYGNGKNIRDWLYVKNNVKMIEKILKNSKYNTEYNITNTNEFENIDIIKKVTNILNVDFESSIEFVKDRLGHDFRYSITSKKIKENNFYVDTDFENDLVETVNKIFKGIEHD